MHTYMKTLACSKNDCQKEMTERQAHFSLQVYGQQLCWNCQREEDLEREGTVCPECGNKVINTKQSAIGHTGNCKEVYKVLGK